MDEKTTEEMGAEIDAYLKELASDKESNEYWLKVLTPDSNGHSLADDAIRELVDREYAEFLPPSIPREKMVHALRGGMRAFHVFAQMMKERELNKPTEETTPETDTTTESPRP